MDAATLDQLGSLGLSSICNVVAAIKVARQAGLGPEDVLLTVATDGAPMYSSELEKVERRDYPDGFDELAAAATFGEHVLGAGAEHVLVCGAEERTRIFNLGYYTWVEQQDVPIDEFVARRHQETWTQMRSVLPLWDEMITEFNARTGVGAR